MVRQWGWTALALALLSAAVPARAHFLELIPSTDIVDEAGGRTVSLELIFSHPMERGPVMALGAPVRFGVLAAGQTQDLRPALTPQTVAGQSAFRAAHSLRAPGDYVFFAEPAPYWEPAEKKFIVHYAKVVVDFGSGGGWDALVGLPMEIRPLSRPYGLWTGNLFRGIVLRHGRPLPFAEVEVEWLNDGSLKPPSDPFVTQTLRADGAGVFAYGLPRAGWWGFNALSEADQPARGPDGKPARTEIGGTIWVRATDMK
jgi:cobalt/nickel transport protein